MMATPLCAIVVNRHGETGIAFVFSLWAALGACGFVLPLLQILYGETLLR